MDMASASVVANMMICQAALLASSGCFCPRKCPATTAPPVASAEKTLISRMFTVSTRDTPDTAASPTTDIIIVSAMPTAIASVCSMTRGMISFFRSLFEYNI